MPAINRCTYGPEKLCSVMQKDFCNTIYHERINFNLTAAGANAQGRNASFPSLHPVLADQ
jgi:hypothetical protein